MEVRLVVPMVLPTAYTNLVVCLQSVSNLFVCFRFVAARVCRRTVKDHALYLLRGSVFWLVTTVLHITLHDVQVTPGSLLREMNRRSESVRGVYGEG